jgi:hypothetical protein
MEEQEQDQGPGNVATLDARLRASRPKEVPSPLRELCIDAALIGGTFLAIVLSIVFAA